MPYKRRYKNRRQVTKYRRKKPDLFDDTADFARKGYYLAKKVARLVNVEQKFHDVDQSAGVALTTSGVVHDLTVIAQGDTQESRDGSSVKPLHFTMRGFIDIHASARLTAARVILFRGKQENGTTPTVTAFLDSANVLSPKNHDNKFQTQTLFDKTYMLQDAARQKVPVEFDLKLFGHVNYQGATTTIEAGGLYLLVISDQGTNTPTMYYKSRMSYTDN